VQKYGIFADLISSIAHEKRMSNNLFIGKVYHRFPELPSTNDLAAELMSKSRPPEGTVVRADNQTAGHGQFGSKWLSAAGQNLLVSIILYPSWLPVEHQFDLSMAAAAALHDTARALYPDGRWSVKWPNDLYEGNRKVAGILIRNSLSSGHIQSSVVGIGLNVNQLTFDPALPNPASLSLISGRNYDTDQVAILLFEALERRYLQLKSGAGKGIKAVYEQIMYRKDIVSEFERLPEGSHFSGIIRGVGESGMLLVEAETPEFFDLKQIRIIIPEQT
jgi:BirA family biotin operon repressor/biotin-[acetyl-CoA-carboxylase] ligase